MAVGTGFIDHSIFEEFLHVFFGNVPLPMNAPQNAECTAPGGSALVLNRNHDGGGTGGLNRKENKQERRRRVARAASSQNMRRPENKAERGRRGERHLV